MTKGMKIVGWIAVGLVTLILGSHAWQMPGYKLSTAIVWVVIILLLAGWLMFFLWDRNKQKKAQNKQE